PYREGNINPTGLAWFINAINVGVSSTQSQDPPRCLPCSGGGFVCDKFITYCSIEQNTIKYEFAFREAIIHM
ncbi:MAG: hypothetical protein LBI30_00565, partial [Holosporales bacterium]|nr:hypothetical protein [Holosporales bacterium]